MLKFYSFPPSPNSRRVHFALEEMGVPYELQVVNLFAGEHKKPEYVAINPNAKTPAIVDDGFSLYESYAIIYYLAEKSQKLLPKDLQARAKAMQWVFYTAAHVQDTFGPTWFQLTFMPEDQRDMKMISQNQESAKNYLAVIEQTLTNNEYLVGGFSLADVAISTSINVHEGAKISLAAYPRVKAWLERIRSRPAWQKTEPKM